MVSSGENNRMYGGTTMTHTTHNLVELTNATTFGVVRSFVECAF
jgi:hypothetical protein